MCGTLQFSHNMSQIMAQITRYICVCKGISNSLLVSLLVKYAMSSANTLTYNYSNG